MHLSFIHSTFFVLIIFVMILLQSQCPMLIFDPDLKDKNEKHENKVSVQSDMKFSNRIKVLDSFNQSKNIIYMQAKEALDGINRIKSQRRQPLNTKLLEDSQLLEGETPELNVKVPAPDIVIKYGNGMFGLIDLDPILHVWRTSFPTLGHIWPRPYSITFSNNVFTLCSEQATLSFKLSGVQNYIIEDAIKRYKSILCDKKVSFYPSNWRQQESILDTVTTGNLLFSKKKNTHNQKLPYTHYLNAIFKGELKTIHINVHTHGHQWPSLYMNESYTLSVTTKGVFINTKETWGLLRALESLSQLAWRTQSGRVFINETRILDQPRFKYRGVMLDTARHFMVKEVIFRNLDAMEMNKMNVFHWHISDDQSFPLITDNHPEFAKSGAYHFETKVYRPTDVKEIVEYARLRGIRVIPEIDSPSHTLSWRGSHPEVLTRCIDLNGRWSGHYGPLNMAAASTYRLLKSFFTDIVHLFPDQWIHLGSDEVPTNCLLTNPAIQNWMQKQNMYSVDFLTDFYMRKLQNIITEIGNSNATLQRGYIVWQEAYERNAALKTGTIVQLWKSQSTSEAVTLARQKIPVIYSACWYLDRQEYGAQWVTHYQCDPTEDTAPRSTVNDFKIFHSMENWKDYILGGEAAMWTEFIDSDNVIPRIWPLACAAAERLWSPSFIKDAERASPRLEEMRCRMLIRSIPTGVAGGAGDCGQRFEGKLSYIFENEKNIDSFNMEFIGNSLWIMFKLLSNFLNLTFLFFIFIGIIALCIYLHRNLRIFPRGLMPIILVSLTLYVMIWIIFQHMLLR